MQEITTEELEHFLYHHHIIDVREKHEVAQGMIPVAVNIPLGELPFSLQDLDKTITYTLICNHGVRSLEACKYLETHGFKTINVTDGMSMWDGDTI